MVLGLTKQHLASFSQAQPPARFKLHADAVEPFQALVAAAEKAGFSLSIASSFRSFSRQLSIWNHKALGQRKVTGDNGQTINMKVLTDLGKIQAIMRYSALPGASRHHWGTDIDVYDANAVSSISEVNLEPKESQKGGPFYEMHQWLDEYLPSTGFYRPYQDDAGGIAREPWHLSYAPVANKYMQQLSVDMLANMYHSQDMALKQSLKQHLNELYSRFVDLKLHN